jgi:zinc protease
LIPSLGLLILAGPPSWAAARQGLPVRQDSLANGLKILVCEKRDAPVVSVQIWYRVGSRNERPGRTGISHLLEHMMFKGGEGPEQFNDAIQKRGGRANAFTSEDCTCYHEEVSRDHWEEALKLEARRMSDLRFDSLEFETERMVVLEERRLGENSPSRMLSEELEAAAYRHHPYRWPVIGYYQDISSIALADLREHYRSFYRPDNAVCVIVGDVDARRAMDAVARHFGPIPRPDGKAGDLRVAEPAQSGPRRTTLKRPSRTPLLYAAYHTVPIGHPDGYALDILASILSDGESSRLYRRLVRERGVAAYAGCYNQIRIDPALFTFYAAPAQGRSPSELEEALLSELDGIRAGGVSDLELRKAKNQIEAQLVSSRQKASGLARQLGSAHTMLSWRHLDGYLDNVRTVGNQDIIRVASRYLVQENLTVAVLDPASDPEPGGDR